MLVASWLFVIASALWVAQEANTMVSETAVHRFAVAFNHDCTLVCAILFLLGSVYFVYLSYPEEMERQMAELQALAEPGHKELTFGERWIWGR